jgi:hypothetical protein
MKIKFRFRFNSNITKVNINIFLTKHLINQAHFKLQTNSLFEHMEMRFMEKIFITRNVLTIHKKITHLRIKQSEIFNSYLLNYENL